MNPTHDPQYNKLIDKWNLYYHLPHDKTWDLSSYHIIMGNIDEAEKLIVLNNSLPEIVVKNCMLFAMRSHITPMWEDPYNKKGGCFSFKVLNKYVFAIWKNIFLLMCGETLCVKKEHNHLINGITISPKKNFCIIKIWLKDCSVQDPNIIVHIMNLSKQGCLFKKHEPEF